MPAPPLAFAPIPNRDAAAAIRGFAYQVETTVQRWLELGDDEALELERGEDIDRIGRAVGAGATDGVGAPDVVRVLEQVKRETAALTLRSAGARAALAHLHAHRAAHPGQRLTLRYTTTASVGTERDGNTLGAPGIEVWRALRAGAASAADTAAEADTRLAGLRGLLRGGPRPAGVDGAHWDAYQRFVADADDDTFRAFVAGVEWSTHSDDESATADATHAHLEARGYARGLAEARALRERLVVHVWGVLMSAGLKRLRREDLNEVLARPTLEEGDRARLDALDALHAQLAARVAALARDVGALAQAQRLQRALAAETTARIAQLTYAAGIRADVAAVVAAPSLEAPAAVRPGADRAESVEALFTGHGAASWMALYGASGTGKSQLALQVAARLAPDPVWLSFRDLSVAAAAVRLDAALARLAVDRLGPEEMAGQPLAAPPGRDALERLARTLGSSACVVLDDVPRFVPDDEFGARVLPLASACAAAGVRVLSTGVHRPAPSVTQRLPDGAVALVPAPPFTPAEVGALFAAYGAAGPILEPAPLAVAAMLRHGHPVLLQVLARRLAARGWPDTVARAIATLTQWQADEAVNDETFQRVLETVEDPASRQLLARLTLIGGEFGFDEAQALASVAPAVDQPRARLHAITGLWVQAEARARYSLSPLVRELGPVDVAPDAARGCHVVLARRLVEQPSIDQFGVVRAFSHFVAGGEPAGAALLLVRALIAAAREPARGAAPLFLSLWVDTPLPAHLPPELALYVRAAQIRAHQAWGLPTAALEADLDARLRRAGPEEAWAVFAAATLMLGGDVTPEHVQRSARWVRLLLTTWPVVAPLWRAHDAPEPPASLALLVWFAVPEAWDAAGLRGWLDLLEAVPPDLRETVFTSDMAHTGADAAANALVAAYERQPPADRRWPEALDALADMERAADRLGAEPLWAAARSARLRVLVQQGDLRAAEDGAEEAHRHAPSAASRFLVAKTMGLAYVDARNLDAAEPWLTAAVACGSPFFPAYAIYTTLWASIAVGCRDPHAAAALATDAVERARAEFNGDKIALVDVLSEAGLALGLAGDEPGALALWDDAGRRVYDRAVHDVEATARLFVLLDPVAYYANGLRRRADPAAGEAPLPLPERGAMLRAGRRANAPASPRLRVAFATFLSDAAQGVGADAVAAHWARVGVDVARATGDLVGAALLAPVLAPEAFAAGEEVAFLSELLVAGRAMHVDGAAAATAALAGDRWTAAMGLLPMAFRLGTLVLDASLETQQAAARAAAACRAVAATSADPAAWDLAARVLERGFVDRAPGVELIALVEPPPSADGDLATAVRSVAYLAASLDPGLSLTTALQGHLAALPWSEPLLLAAPRLYRATLSRFLLAYWRRALERSGFRFRAPRALAGELAELAVLPAAEDARPLVRRLTAAVMASLEVPAQPAAARWLARLGGAVPDRSPPGQGNGR